MSSRQSCADGYRFLECYVGRGGQPYQSSEQLFRVFRTRFFSKKIIVRERQGDSPFQPLDLLFLPDGGEMGSLIRAYDWSSTSLGAPADWPQSLRTAVRLMLTTRHPMFIFWGRQHVCLYNDAYRLSIGTEKHPAMLGTPAREA